MPRNTSPVFGKDAGKDAERNFGKNAHTAPVILVVEDEVTVRFCLAEYLADHGFAIVEASDAAEAVAILLTRGPPVDLVFSDVNMPGPMNGLGLAQWVHDHRPEVPVILTSGLPQKVIEAKGLCEETGETVLPKPYDLDEVEQRIRGLLR
jgi:DNA-binding response OmpR family regulator